MTYSVTRALQEFPNLLQTVIALVVASFMRCSYFQIGEYKTEIRRAETLNLISRRCTIFTDQNQEPIIFFINFNVLTVCYR